MAGLATFDFAALGTASELVTLDSAAASEFAVHMLAGSASRVPSSRAPFSRERPLDRGLRVVARLLPRGDPVGQLFGSHGTEVSRSEAQQFASFPRELSSGFNRTTKCFRFTVTAFPIQMSYMPYSSCDITVVVEPTRSYGFDSKTNGANCREGTASSTITCRPLPTSTRLISTRAGGSKRPSIAAMSRSVMSATS